MTVRLCLQKVAALQKMRGTMRWVQDNNAHVVPKPGDGCLPELLGLCRETRSKMVLPVQPSQRERLAEVALRDLLNERRKAEGCSFPLLPHDGLTAAARVLAFTQRRRVREAEGDPRGRRVGGKEAPPRPVDTEVQKLLLRTPLPPGFDAAHLHFSSDELPHIFGLASAKGNGPSAAGGESFQGGGGQAADILAKEAVGFWAARQTSDLVWPYASVCGVGVALDYTVNRGFMVVLMVGYEGVTPLADVQGVMKSAGAQLLKRRADMAAAAEMKG